MHLQYLGYPIVNDIGYGGKFIGNFLIKLKFPELCLESSKKRKRYDDDDVNNNEKASQNIQGK